MEPRTASRLDGVASSVSSLATPVRSFPACSLHHHDACIATAEPWPRLRDWRPVRSEALGQ